MDDNISLIWLNKKPRSVVRFEVLSAVDLYAFPFQTAFFYKK
jgi:hypothetical protein